MVGDRVSAIFSSLAALPTGAACTLKMRPTTMPLGIPAHR